MVKILRNNWILIVTTILFIDWCVDAGAVNTQLWRYIRRFLENEDLPKIGSVTPINVEKSNIAEEDVKRARLRQHAKTETVHLGINGVRESSSKTPPRSKPRDGEKHKHRFRIEKTASSKSTLETSTDVVTKKITTPYDDFAETTKRVVEKKKVDIESKLNLIDSREKPSKTDVDVEKRKYRNESDVTLAVRAKKYRSPHEQTVKRSRFRKLSTLRITKMPQAYQLQDDGDDRSESLKRPCSGKNRLNPYAIQEQMLRYMHTHRDTMNITMEVIGRTAEYNDIVLLKITDIKKANNKYNFRAHKYADEAPEKKIVFIVHGLAVRGMDSLMDSEATFTKIMSFYEPYLKYFDLFIIPIANPDGFTAVLNTHHGKFWNKNMSPQASCAGVMLDRNFDVEFNLSHGISPCSHMYPGALPFSEPETRAVRDIFHLYSQKIIAYIHVHASSYDPSIIKGDAILYPHGYTNVQHDDDKYLDIKGEIEEAMKNASFRSLSVTVDTLNSWYGKVSGTSVDYAATIYGIPYAMEFLMQLYEDLATEALNHIWKRAIDVVFKNIYKSLNYDHLNNN